MLDDYIKRNVAELLTRSCHEAGGMSFLCTANIVKEFPFCPLGYDGICENVTVEDWLRMMEAMKK